MKTTYRSLAAIILFSLFSLSTYAQTASISGNVKSNPGNENVSAVSILVKGTTIGAYTNDRGNFKISGALKFPVTLVVSSVGYGSKEIAVASAGENVKINLDQVSSLAQEVVVSASRLPERILESPVSIERVSAANIRNSASTNYYDIIANLKGVDLVTSSLNFKTPSTRGFNGSGNLRLNQLVDGMDNQAPGLNFAVGSMVGPTELDIDNLELLNGASSALYGPGGMNGTLLISSKNPFKYQGLSAQVKQGVMHLDDDARKSSGYNDFSVRYAKAISDKFAFKIAGQYLYAKDWVAQDYRNFDKGLNNAKGAIKSGDRTTDPNYNGVNVYGDETTANILGSLQGVVTSTPILGVIPLPSGPAYIPAAGVLGSFTSAKSLNVSRTGYNENDIIDPTTKNLRVSGALHYKITPSVEGSLSANWGSGTTVYTGSDRYNLRDFKMAQYKAEVKHKNWFVRAYTTQEDAGNSFNATATSQLFNEAWKSSADPANGWYAKYIKTLVTNSAGLYGQAYVEAYSKARQAGLSDSLARVSAAAFAPGAISPNQMALLNAARDSADKGRPVVGSAQFKKIFDSIAARSISNGGGKFIDKSSLYMTEGQYNLSDMVKVAEVLVGANFKQYVLNSEGTIFADTAGRIKINEVGAYALVAKKLFNDKLKLTASGRYDKNSNFKGRFTPRFSAVVTVAKDNNVRLSYQTAYRFPSTQNQWINLVVGGGVRLIGGLPQLRDYYKFNTNPVYTPESVTAFSQSAAGGNPNPGLLKQQTFGEYKPESATSYEIGYKTLINKKLLIDLYGYYTQYENFIGRSTVLQSSDGTLAGLSNYKIISVSVNTTEKVNTQGWGLSAEYLLPHNFAVNGNVYMDEIKNVPDGFVSYYNTPKLRTNIGFSNTGMLYQKRIGFSLQYRYQDGFVYESDFGKTDVTSFATLDAQINYKFPAIKSMIKIGGTNVTNHYYTNGYGLPSIGALYYASFAYNVF